MDLTAVADIADLLAAIGVICSLFYVGYQVKQARVAVRAATAQARTDLGVQLISTRYTSDIAELLVKSQDHPEQLSKAEVFKLKSFFSAHVRHSQNLFYQQQQGLLDEFFTYGVARTTAYWVRNYRWAEQEWKRVQNIVPQEFSTYINSELSEHPQKYDA